MTGTDSNVRIESFPCSSAPDIQVHIANGEVVVELIDTDVITVAISPGPADPRGGSGPSADAVAEAIRKVKTHFTRAHLVVQAPSQRQVPIQVVVRAPRNAKLHLTGANPRLTVTGPARSLLATWGGTGSLTAERIDGTCKVRAGNGRLQIGASNGKLDVRISEANVDVQRIGGRGAKLTTGAGVVSFGTVEADTLLTTGAGTITVADAAAGHLRVRTGPGSIRVSVRPGVAAKVDISSRRGSAQSNLPEGGSGRAVSGAPLKISAASTSGDILVTPAA